MPQSQRLMDGDLRRDWYGLPVAAADRTRLQRFMTDQGAGIAESRSI